MRWRLLLGARPVTEVTEVTAGAGSGGRLANLARPGRGRGHAAAAAESRNSRKPPSSSSSSSAVSVSARPRPRARQHAGRVRSIREVKLSDLATPRPLSMVSALGHFITVTTVTIGARDITETRGQVQVVPALAAGTGLPSAVAVRV